MAASTYNSDRIKEADFLKGLAILAVLLVHTSWNFIKAENLDGIIISNAVINTFSRFAVPLFIFISGMVLSSRYFNNLSKRTFYLNRVRSILPPYIIFSIIYMLCEIIYLSRMPTGKEVVIHWMTGGYGYLWFLVLIMQLYIMFPFMITIYKKLGSKSEHLLLAAFAVELTWAIINIGMPKEFLFPSGIFYFVLGIYANDRMVNFNIKSIKSYILIAAVVFLTLFISYIQITNISYYGSFESIPIKHPISSTVFSIILYTLIIFLLYNTAVMLRDRENFVTIIVCSLGIYSFGIFLVHFFFQQLVTLLLMKMGIAFDNALFYIILFTSMLLLSYITCYIISRFTFGNYIIGHKPARALR